MADSQRLDDLRRRVQKDPASIAFAQLAEELRRAGHSAESVEVCRAGLAIHPGYLSARVTLGRALIELNALEEAQLELEQVLKSAPENLAAIRGLADIHHRRGELPDALAQYRAALELARHDPDLEETVATLTREVTRSGGPDPVDGLSFEQMSAQLLAHGPPPAVDPAPAPADMSAGPEAPPASAAAPSTLAPPAPEAPADPSNPDHDETVAASAAERRRNVQVVAELEHWLTAIDVARTDRHA